MKEKEIHEKPLFLNGVNGSGHKERNKGLKSKSCMVEISLQYLLLLFNPLSILILIIFNKGLYISCKKVEKERHKEKKTNKEKSNRKR